MSSSSNLLCLVQHPKQPDLKLSLVQASGGYQPTFRLTFQNVSAHDLLLYLGMIAPKQYLDAIQFRLEQPSGEILSLELIGPAIAPGHIDPLILPLPTGCAFTLPVDLHQYNDYKQDVWHVDLRPGRYKLLADYSGALPAPSRYSDMSGIAFMPHWTGHVSSKPLRFTVYAH